MRFAEKKSENFQNDKVMYYNRRIQSCFLGRGFHFFFISELKLIEIKGLSVRQSFRQF